MLIVDSLDDRPLEFRAATVAEARPLYINMLRRTFVRCPVIFDRPFQKIHKRTLRLLLKIGGLSNTDSPHGVATVGAAHLHVREVHSALRMVLTRAHSGVCTFAEGVDLLLEVLDVPGTFSALVLAQEI